MTDYVMAQNVLRILAEHIRQDAAEESINTIFELAELKKKRLKYLIVTGCIAERYKKEAREELPV